jgi:hypothetical protein
MNTKVYSEQAGAELCQAQVQWVGEIKANSYNKDDGDDLHLHLKNLGRNIYL